MFSLQDHHTEHNFYSVLNKCTNFPANICHNLSWEAKRSFHKNICTCFDPTWLSLNLLVVAKRKWIRMSIICGVQFMAWIIHTPHIVMIWLYQCFNIKKKSGFLLLSMIWTFSLDFNTRYLFSSDKHNTNIFSLIIAIILTHLR